MYKLKDMKSVKNNKVPGLEQTPYEFYTNASDIFLEKLGTWPLRDTSVQKGRAPTKVLWIIIFSPSWKRIHQLSSELQRGILFIDGKVIIGFDIEDNSNMIIGK